MLLSRIAWTLLIPPHSHFMTSRWRQYTYNMRVRVLDSCSVTFTGTRRPTSSRHIFDGSSTRRGCKVAPVRNVFYSNFEIHLSWSITRWVSATWSLKGVPVASSTSSFCIEMKALVLTIPKMYVTSKFGVGKYELWSLEEKNSEFW